MKKVFNIFVLAAFLVFVFLLYRQDISPVVFKGAQKGLAAPAAAAGAASDFLPKPGFVSVSRVVDGDTIDILQDGKIFRARLIGINAPETVDPKKPVECFGREASDKLRSLLAGRQVRLEIDGSQERYDKYGRLLAYVFLPDGTNVNLAMVQKGFAREYTYHSPYKFQKEFRAAEAAAESLRVGLWSACR